MLPYLALTFALLAPPSPSPAPVPAPTATPIAPAQIAGVLAHPLIFDGRHLSVSGTVANLAEKTSRRGNDYTTFDLCDGASCIHVYSQGHPKLTNGQMLKVTGKFFADRHVGNLDFKNELDADEGSL